MRCRFVNIGRLAENGVAEPKIGDLGRAWRNARVGFGEPGFSVSHCRTIYSSRIVDKISARRVRSVCTGICSAGDAVTGVIDVARGVPDGINLLNQVAARCAAGCIRVVRVGRRGGFGICFRS
jgi:hypothetical protein